MLKGLDNLKSAPPGTKIAVGVIVLAIGAVLMLIAYAMRSIGLGGIGFLVALMGVAPILVGMLDAVMEARDGSARQTSPGPSS